MADNNIVVQGLCKSFADFFLDNISFVVPKGRIVGFIGENGAGKSTTINLILIKFCFRQALQFIMVQLIRVDWVMVASASASLQSIMIQLIPGGKNKTEPLPAKAGRFGLLLKQPKVVSAFWFSFSL